MNYANHELLRRLAAEYSLGTLRGPARRRFESVMKSAPEAREHVNFWDWRLSEFGQAVEPVSPPLGLRAELLATIAPHAVPLPSRPAELAPGFVRRRRRATRRLAVGAALAASLLLAFQIGRQQRAPDAASPLAAAEPPAPIYVAQVGMPASNVQWLISLSPDRKQLMVSAADDFLTLGRFTAELWVKSAHAGAVRLGALPVERDATVAIPLPEKLRGEDHATFAITLEPQGAASTVPAGPVFGTAENLDEI